MQKHGVTDDESQCAYVMKMMDVAEKIKLTKDPKKDTRYETQAVRSELSAS